MISPLDQDAKNGSDSQPVTFDFLSEISKGNTYSLLFPDAKAGLAIIWLYDRMESGVFPHNRFKGTDIHDALRAVNPSMATDNGRHPREYYNGLVASLQEYFLRYDEARQEYSLKEYAFKFCRHAHAILQSNFSPTRIEKICIALHKKLQDCITLDLLLDWFKVQFDTFKPLLKEQLDFLDRQIDQSVSSLRANNRLSLQEGKILETLQLIDNRFELIREQNRELRSAFREFDEIRRLIELQASNYNNGALDKEVHNAVTFFQDMRRTLSIIDRRLDRIQPKVRQLFSNLNKPRFNARIETFLRHLVDASTLRTEGTRKTVDLPAGIPRLSRLSFLQQFTIIERKANLFPVAAKKRLIVPESPEAKSKALAALQQRLDQQDEITTWLDRLQDAVNRLGKLYLSEYFFQIAVPGNDQTMTLAVLVIYSAVSFFERQTDYIVDIDPQNIIQHPSFQTTLWEITITRKL